MRAHEEKRPDGCNRQGVEQQNPHANEDIQLCPV